MVRTIIWGAVDFAVTNLSYQPTIDEATTALQSRNLALLRYLYDNFSLIPDEFMWCIHYRTSVEMIKFLFEVNTQWKFSQKMVNYVGKYGDLESCRVICDNLGLYPDAHSCDMGWESGAGPIYNWLSKIQV